MWYFFVDMKVISLAALFKATKLNISMTCLLPILARLVNVIKEHPDPVAAPSSEIPHHIPLHPQDKHSCIHASAKP